jgi:dihydrodiol dehydrogenase / D-xylose 1-dehydrogenase (NADP)
MLRWGILGTSFISNTVVEAIQKSSKSSVQAVFGRSPDKLAKFADKYSISSRHTSIESLLDDAEVDVIYVGLPSHLHHDAVLASLKRGKPCLSEKSLATTLEDAIAMADAHKKSNTFFLEGLMYLSHPLMQKTADIVRSGELGQIRSFSGHYAADIWSKANPLGKGTIYNLGCYPVSLVHFMMETAFGSEAFKTRATVQGSGNRSETTGVIEEANLSVRFENGTLATILSTDRYGSGFGFTALGDKGVLRFKTNPWLPKAGESIIEIQPYGQDARQIVVTSPHDAFEWQVKTVEDCLASGKLEAERPSPNITQSVEIMGLLTEWENSIA